MEGLDFNRSVRWNVGMIAVKRAANTPDKAAVIFEDEPYTFKQLNDDANIIAHYLQSIGLKKGDRVAILALNCCEFIAFYFAVAKLGLIMVPLNFRLVGPELAYQLKDSGSRFLLFHDEQSWSGRHNNTEESSLHLRQWVSNYFLDPEIHKFSAYCQCLEDIFPGQT